MLNQSEWFTEVNDNYGLAFSLKIKEKCTEIQSPFQSVAIYETTDFGYLMTIDDIIMLTSRDNFLYHEMLVHPALFTHPNPKNIAIIGGGDCGSLREALKHPVDSVIQIEIDEVVTQLAEKYFPELCESNHDPRAQLLFIDGIRWMQEAKDQSLDVIIVDSTDPLGPAVGLFNQAFYEQCHRVLKPNGILVQQSESPILHQSLQKDMREAMFQAGFPHLLTLPFPQPVYPSGWFSCTMASKLPGFNDFRRDTTLLKKLNTQYYQFEVHEAGLHPVPFLKALER
ncbi:MAG: polyamine aminopropyltransferase [Candidatus Berkiella sp.]